VERCAYKDGRGIFFVIDASPGHIFGPETTKALLNETLRHTRHWLRWLCRHVQEREPLDDKSLQLTLPDEYT
jgi:hypothetical protein